MNISHKKVIKEIIHRCVPENSFFRKVLIKKRINSLFQYCLLDAEVKKAETGVIEKSVIVAQCEKKWPKKVLSLNTKVDNLLNTAPCYLQMKDSQKQKIKEDIVFCFFAYGFIPAEYLCFRLDLLNMNERCAFISERDHVHFYYQMNDIFEADIFNDKMKTYSFFKKYYGREIVSIDKAEDFKVFRDFISKNPVFVKKEVYESCGKSIEKIDFNACGKSDSELFEELLAKGKTVLEECVVQHPSTAVFNSSSVNTVRVITFNTKHGILAPYTFMKIGRAGSFVDNGGAGGILVGIDEKSGVLNTRGIDELHREYEVHPDSGVKFVGHQLPDWDKAIAMCKEMSAMIPKVRYIGWDLAYTKDNEWVVIEGNGLSQFIGPQTIWQCGIKQDVINIMLDMDLMA